MEGIDPLYVKAAFSRLRQNPVSVFGGEAHKFEVNPPVPEVDIVAFERRHDIKLPPDYRAFMTQLGNGGAGPGNGIFPLGFMDHDFDLRRWSENDGVVGTLSKPFPFETEWNDLSARPANDLLERDPGEYDRQIERFDEVYWSSELVHGAVPICHLGCAIRVQLIVTGQQAGKLWKDRRSEYGGLKPLLLSDGSPATFSGWYKEWLEKCLASAHLDRDIIL